MIIQLATLSLAGLTALSAALVAQSPSQFQRRGAATPRETLQKGTASPSPTPEQLPDGSQQEIETLKTNTNLVMVPVIATDATGLYVADLVQNDFNIWEDGTKQQIAFLATVSAPFHVVLMLDTSASTQEKLGLIRQAAISFVEQLQPADRVKVISFDDQVRDLNQFTNDRSALRAAINKTQPGQGTKLYDAMELALSAIRRIEGRKAIVLFTDGVDYHSDEASFDSTMRGLDEEGVIVYPIRYDTRAETERLARNQAEDQGPPLPTIGVIRTPPMGTTAPTFPSDDPDSVRTSGTMGRSGPLGLPPPGEIFRRRRGTDPTMEPTIDPDRLPPPGGNPPGGGPNRRRSPGGGGTPQTGPTASDPRDIPDSTGGRTSRGRGDTISAMLDQLYLTADSYLNDLANKTGGRMLRSDTLGSLPDAFAKIAAELRTQYTLGYYPSNGTRDGQYRKIKVASTRQNVKIRARSGYRAPSGG